MPPAAPPTNPLNPEGLVSGGVVAVLTALLVTFLFNHTSQTAAGKTSAESSAAFSATACIDMGGMAAAAARKVIAGKALKSAESSGRNHSLRQHTAAGMADIDAQTRHKRINLL